MRDYVEWRLAQIRAMPPEPPYKPPASTWGESCPVSKLTDAQVRLSKALREQKFSYPHIIRLLDLPVGPEGLRSACTGRTWKHG